MSGPHTATHVIVSQRTRERTKCFNCPGKSRDGAWIDWYGRRLYLCPRCLVAAKRVLESAGVA
jgi:hypothetical protein